MRRSWDICTHPSPKLQNLLCHQIPNIWMVHGFSNKFPALQVSSTKPTYHMRTNWNINTHTIHNIQVITLLPNDRSNQILKKTQSPHLLQDMSFFLDLIPTEWLSKHFVRASSLYMEQDIHLKISFSLRSLYKDLKRLDFSQTKLSFLVITVPCMRQQNLGNLHTYPRK